MKYIVLSLLLFIHCAATAQNRVADSLNMLLKEASSDTTRIRLMNQISITMLENNLDSSVLYIKNTIEMAKKVNDTKGEAIAHRTLAQAFARKSNFAEANKEIKMAEQMIEPLADSLEMANIYGNYGLIYGMQSKYDSSIIFYKKNISYTEHLADKKEVTRAYQNLAIDYQMQSDFRQAIFYQTKALQIAEAVNDVNALAYIYVNMAITYENLDDKTKPEQLYLKGIEYAKKAGIKNVELYAYSNLASLYDKEKNNTKTYEFAMKAVQLGKATGDQAITASSLSKAAAALANQKQFAKAEELNAEAVVIADSLGQPLTKFQTLNIAGYIKKLQNKYTEAIILYQKGFSFMQDADMYTVETAGAYKELSECYEAAGDTKNALLTFKKATQINDSVTSRENVRKATELSMNYDFEKKQQAQKAEQEKEDSANKTKLIFLVAILLLFITLSTVSLLAYRREQKSKALVNVQKKEVESTLSELKITQAQLIQSEKMASLGELTAGIAHEIQNPLNFVNNFSEVNKEMIAEMREEIEKGNYEEVKNIADNIAANEEKITHHGKRADAIVKGMLQHSRKNTGVKEPTGINALCDEYLRLSYHGLRAKDKMFNAGFTTEFDSSIGKINIVSQDVGRVLLNIFNNAFYATNTKKKTTNEDYKPVITVQTKKVNDTAEIIISDNGNGIPQNIVDKIFQPFFTTKPTGEGTGLGLSLSYDIITKEHNGTIKAESKEGQGSQFIITLPLSLS